MNIPKTEKKRVVIIGGGFAGISLAKNLKGADIQLVLLDQHNYHTFQPLLYQVSTSGLEPDSIAYPIRKILRKLSDFYFRLATVQHIDTETRCVTTDIGNLAYDYLVLATGTKTNFFGNEQIAKYALPMKFLPDALNIRSLMLQNFEYADDCTDMAERKAHLNFCIIGAGPTGVELSGALAELKRNVFPKDYKHMEINEMEIHLFEGGPQVLPPMSDHASKEAEKFLKELGVIVHLNAIASDYDGELLTLDDGATFRTKNCIWTAGVTGASIEGFKTDVMIEKSSRYAVNQFNQINGFDTVFAIGDIAQMDTQDYPKGHPQVAQPAIQQGEHLAKNIKRMLSGKEMTPFKYTDKGTMATVGRNKAVADIKKFRFGGSFAWLLWMVVHLMALVGFRNRVIVFFNWVYNYINYDKAARLIVRPFKPKT
ncbi:NAD(P)/FAD-dependent oxidoreductase [Aggregatimonas sangjinii]|uniref:NADH:ubiquinone reductase (non-electrogenic) n=1 Tax=Aggregatimonas sangjinii TaxID=2583587 RepID=A0A5B7SUK3_9FLAO|nr:NAD(P)/FAD-dependent oxidoreductase [Aggregatimonas sangjinii]QCX02266.1 NAD(P)/FAD-dependent oxidoreductase [Aggregatimonas sangjinii]